MGGLLFNGGFVDVQTVLCSNELELEKFQVLFVLT